MKFISCGACFFSGKQYATLLLFYLNCIKIYNTDENVS